MSLPPVVVELRGQVGDLKSKLGEAQRDIDKLAKTGAGSLDKMAAVGKGALLGLGGAFVTLGAFGAKQAIDQEAANKVLQKSIENTGNTWAEYAGQVDKAQASARRMGFSDDEATDSLNRLTQATQSPARALRDLALVEDISRARKMSLMEATDLLAKVETGHVALLGRIGIDTKDASGATISQEEAVRRLTAMYGGSAAAYTGTFAGKLAVLKAEGEELAEKFGNLLLPAVLKVGGGLVTGAGFLERHRAAAYAAGAVVAGVLVPAMGAYAVVQARAFGAQALSAIGAVPALFLRVGAAMQGTTAAAVVLNEAESSVAATTALGAAPFAAVTAGLIAGKVAFDRNAASARAWARGFADAHPSLDALEQEIKALNAEADRGTLFRLGGLRVALPGAAKAGSEAAALIDQYDKLAGAGQQKATVDDAAAVAADAAAEADGHADAEAEKRFQTVQKLTGVLGNLLAAQQAEADAGRQVAAATGRLNEAKAHLADLERQGVVDAKAVAAATKDHDRAAQGVTRALQAQADAQRALDDILHPSARTQTEASLGLSQANTTLSRAQLRVREATARVAAVQRDGTATAADVQEAHLDLVDAQNALTQATLDQGDAQQRVSDLLPENITSTEAYQRAQETLDSATGGVAEAQQAELESASKLREAEAGDPQRAKDIAAARKDVAAAEGEVASAKGAATKAAYDHAVALDEETRALGANADAVANIQYQLDRLASYDPAAAPYIQQLLGVLGGGGSQPASAGGHGSAPAYQRGGVRLMAGGGDAVAGEMAWVGENGPELVQFSRAAHVYPTGTGPGGGTVLNIHEGAIVVQGAQAPPATGRAVMAEIADFAHRNGFRVARGQSWSS